MKSRGVKMYAREQDDSAIEELVYENMDSVKKAAIKYYNRLSDDKKKIIQLDELISAGYEGLVKAAKKYNDRRGAKFITYAYKWIDNAIKNELVFYLGALPLYLDDEGVGEIADESISADERIDEASNTSDGKIMDVIAAGLKEAGLSDAEISIYCMLNGIGQEKTKNLVKISRRLGISEIHVRRLKQSAQEKVRSLTS